MRHHLISPRAKLAVAIAVFSTAAAAAAAAAGASPPHIRAFDRPERASDRLPMTIHIYVRDLRHPPLRPEKVADSRRVATYTDGRGRRAVLYAAKTRTQTCIVSTWGHGAGASCSRPTEFFTNGRVAIMSGHLFFGVAADDVASVVIVGSRGVRHAIELSADGAFIYDCHAWNGCAGLIARVESYDSRGRLISATPWG